MILAFLVTAGFAYWLLARRDAEALAARESARQPAPAAPVPVAVAPPPAAPLTREERERLPAPKPRFDPAAEPETPVAPMLAPEAAAPPCAVSLHTAIAAAVPGKPMARAPFKPPARRTPERAALAAQLAQYAALPAEQCVRHPLAAEFPGEVPGDVPRLRTLFTCARGFPGWTSTGFYAPPGEIITVELSEDDAARGFGLRIGGHTDNLTTGLHAEWRRFPDLSRRFELDRTTVRVANPFGGMVYVTDAARVRPERPLQLRFTGVVRAPSYVSGKTSAEDWARQRAATRGVPWGEIVGERMTLLLPGEQLRATADPEPYAKHWDALVSAQYRLVGVDQDPLRHERLVPDPQPAYALSHAGYPIVIRLAQAREMTAPSALTDDNWNVNHEIGHNLLRPAWTFRSYEEVINNLLGLYAMETVSGVKMSQVRGGTNWRAIQTQAIAFPDDEDPFVRLSFYCSPITQFGWEPLRKTFARYDAEPIGALEDADKKAEFVFRWSVACGVDLRRYAALFGFPRNAHSDRRFAELATPLPDWMPEGCPPNLLGVKRVRRPLDLGCIEDSHAQARRAAAEAAAEEQASAPASPPAP